MDYVAFYRLEASKTVAFLPLARRKMFNIRPQAIQYFIDHLLAHSAGSLSTSQRFVCLWDCRENVCSSTSRHA